VLFLLRFELIFDVKEHWFPTTSRELLIGTIYPFYKKVNPVVDFGIVHGGGRSWYVKIHYRIKQIAIFNSLDKFE